MGVRTKKRRKLIYQRQLYVWYVKIGEEDNYFYLNIISQDKKYIFSYPIQQNRLSPNRHFIIAKGRYFQGQQLDGRWNRFYTPPWEDEVITPSLVAEILSWCLEGRKAEQTSYGQEGVFA